MILDVARHKFYEAVITLFTIALVIVFSGVLLDSGSIINHSGDGAPLGMLISELQQSHIVIASIAALILTIHLSFGITRATIRSHLYVANSFATMSIIPVVLLIFATCGATLLNLCVVWLASEAIRRIFYAFNSERRQQAIFTAMLALGMMPLIDSSLFIVVCTLPLILISLRSSVRDVIIGTTGMLLPIATYAYVVWYSGGEFMPTIAMFYERMLAPSSTSIIDSLSIYHLIAGGSLALLGILSAALYLRNSMSMPLATRHTWRFILSAILLFACSFVLLPSASVTLLLLMAIAVGIIVPMLLLRLSTPLATLIYVLMLGCALAGLT